MPLCLRYPCGLLGRCGLQLAAALHPRHLSDKDGSDKEDADIELPPEPTTCCMSGCANCVWVEYAQTVAKILGDNDERARQIVLAKIKDPNLRMFLSMEMQNLKSLREKPTEDTQK
ncbi:oxidoreductase-like domain-containing protein 1 [Drosophila grimshawi]|uniref:GH10459 n=1 Tax=Drosophila grimshawi TaxID=7222 RepID=B4JTB2_DROGR|nr:oxidoreductase-like domain-containing protein 1 [Drosophila grimshawi]EDV95002.1 GH10459 [Drosophila grimshawi]